MRILVLSLFLLSSWGATYCFGAAEWFSDKPRELGALLADPRETQVRCGFMQSGDGRSFLDMGLGGHLGVFRMEDETHRVFSLAARALFSARFAFRSRSFDYQNGDMIGGAAFSLKQGTHSFELFPHHQSSHLGDDVMASGEATFKNFSYEALRFLHSHHWNSTLRTYEGMEVKWRADPSYLLGKITAIAGGDWHFSDQVPGLFVAFDLHFRQENDWAPNSTFVLGIDLGDRNVVQRFQRLFIEIFNGYSEMGQFSDRREFYGLIGMGVTL